MGGISIWQLLIVLVIVLLLFGAKRLRNVGSDLGTAVKGFRTAIKDGEEEAANKPNEQLDKKESDDVIDVEVARREESKPKEGERS